MRVKIPRDRLSMCPWVWSHFHDYIDFYGVVFSLYIITHFCCCLGVPVVRQEEEEEEEPA